MRRLKKIAIFCSLFMFFMSFVCSAETRVLENNGIEYYYDETSAYVMDERKVGRAVERKVCAICRLYNMTNDVQLSGTIYILAHEEYENDDFIVEGAYIIPEYERTTSDGNLQYVKDAPLAGKLWSEYTEGDPGITFMYMDILHEVLSPGSLWADK